MSKLPISTKPSRIWFLNQGCAKLPLELTIGKVLYAHPNGYFLSAYGTVQVPGYSPSHRTPGRGCHNGKRGQCHPNMTNFGAMSCHRLMAYAFAKEPCPTFYYKSGKPYKGIVHHLIEKPEDYRPANLLWWLSQPEHSEADRRRRALEAIVPNGNMYAISYARHRQLQDPRRMSREQFEIELDKLKKQFEEEAKMQAMNERALRAMKALQPTPEQRQRGLDAQAGERTKYYDPFIERETVEIEICIDD